MLIDMTLPCSSAVMMTPMVPAARRVSIRLGSPEASLTLQRHGIRCHGPGTSAVNCCTPPAVSS